MSIVARQKIVNSTNAFFQNHSQISDLMDIHCVRTETIALILELMQKGHILEFTAIKSDHHDDSGLGQYCHFHGAAFDCWPLTAHRAGAYADAKSPQMSSLLRDAYASKWRAQVGLAGSADSPLVLATLGFATYPTDASLFQDSGADHIHIGALYPREVPHL